MTARVLSSKVNLFMAPADLVGVPLNLGEIDEFRSNEKTEVSIRRPMGRNLQTPILRVAGYELSFKGGKVNWHLARWAFLANRTSRGFGRTVTFNVLQTIDHYDGVREQYLYQNVVFHNLEQIMNSNEPIEETISAFAYKKEIGPVDTTLFSLDGIGWNAVATAATNFRRESVAKFIPASVQQALDIYTNRPF